VFRFHITVPDPRSRSGVKRLPTIWGAALVGGGYALVACAACAILLIVT
jgi:hypothetical protein